MRLSHLVIAALLISILGGCYQQTAQNTGPSPKTNHIVKTGSFANSLSKLALSVPQLKEDARNL